MTVLVQEKIPPRLQKRFALIKREVLGPAYKLDIRFVSPRESQKVNDNYRGKDKPTNILSFPFDHSSGQLIMCPAVAKKEAAVLRVTPGNYLQYLFIHGLLHLKGFDHSATMESKEQEYCAKFKLRLGDLWHEQLQQE
jgi:rRNA maturation RNase YbeY